MSEQFILKNILNDTYYICSNDFTKKFREATIFDKKESAKTSILMDDLFYNTNKTPRLKIINLRKLKLEQLKDI